MIIEAATFSDSPIRHLFKECPESIFVCTKIVHLQYRSFPRDPLKEIDNVLHIKCEPELDGKLTEKHIDLVLNNIKDAYLDARLTWYDNYVVNILPSILEDD